MSRADDDAKPRLHIFGQRKWHHNAYVIGNRVGLQALRDAIDVALNENNCSYIGGVGTTTVQPSDWEDYTVAVFRDIDNCEDVETAYWDQEVEGKSRDNSLIPNERFIMAVGAVHERARLAELDQEAPVPAKPKSRGKKRKKR